MLVDNDIQLLYSFYESNKDFHNFYKPVEKMVPLAVNKSRIKSISVSERDMLCIAT